MIPEIIDAKHIENYILWLSFKDGTEGYVDLSKELDGEVFEPLKEILYFKQFKIIGHTIAWENGADFSPEFLLESITLGGIEKKRN